MGERYTYLTHQSECQYRVINGVQMSRLKRSFSDTYSTKKNSPNGDVKIYPVDSNLN